MSKKFTGEEISRHDISVVTREADLLVALSDTSERARERFMREAPVLLRQQNEVIEDLQELIEEHEDKIEELEKDHAKDLEDKGKEFDERAEELNDRIVDLAQSVDELRAERDVLVQERRALKLAHELERARFAGHQPGQQDISQPAIERGTPDAEAAARCTVTYGDLKLSTVRINKIRKALALPKSWANEVIDKLLAHSRSSLLLLGPFTVADLNAIELTLLRHGVSLS